MVMTKSRFMEQSYFQLWILLNKFWYNWHDNQSILTNSIQQLKNIFIQIARYLFSHKVICPHRRQVIEFGEYYLPVQYLCIKKVKAEHTIIHMQYGGQPLGEMLTKQAFWSKLWQSLISNFNMVDGVVLASPSSLVGYRQLT